MLTAAVHRNMKKATVSSFFRDIELWSCEPTQYGTEQGWHDGEELRGLWVCETYEQAFPCRRVAGFSGGRANALFSKIPECSINSTR